MNLLTGDSHITSISPKNFTTILCAAGSAKGLNNPESKSQYNKILIDNIRINNYDNLFFLFGGVDVDFCFIFKYSKNNNLDYKEFNLNVIENYLKFILNNFSNKSVIILSVGLPCLDDDHFIHFIANGDVLNLENGDKDKTRNQVLSCEVLPDIYKRTEITLNFNETLKDEINKLDNPNIKYLDITSFSYDSNLKRIKDDYFTRVDHHSFGRNTQIVKILDDYLSTLTVECPDLEISVSTGNPE
jgi:hypothetical protein